MKILMTKHDLKCPKHLQTKNHAFHKSPMDASINDIDEVHLLKYFIVYMEQ